MRILMYFFRVGQYLAAILTICTIIGLFMNGWFYILFTTIGIFLYMGWKNEADSIKDELKL